MKNARGFVMGFRDIALIICWLMGAVVAAAASSEPMDDGAAAATTWPASMASGTLPVMYINTENAAPIVDKVTQIPAGLWVEIPDGCMNKDFALGSESEPVGLVIRGRGNSTWSLFEKKPYKIKFKSKTSLLGMPKHKHFALLACASSYTDWMSQAVGKELANIIGLGWTPRYEPVEVVLNGEYIGLYFVYESVKIDSGRLDIYEQEDLNEDAATVTYGWLVEIDNNPDECQIVVPEGPYSMRVTYHTPEELSDVQLDWLTHQFTEMGTITYGDNPEKWTDFIDPVSLSRYFIVRELMTDWDGFNGSMYLYRDLGDEVWRVGPMWDNVFCGWDGNHGWTMNQLPQWSRWKLMPGIFMTKSFENAFTQEWRQFYPLFSEVKERMLELADKCFYADRSNGERWPQPHYITSERALAFYALMESKARWMDDNTFFVTSDVESCESGNGAVVTAERFYSIDGRCLDTAPSRGLYLRKTEFSDGTSLTIKAIGGK